MAPTSIVGPQKSKTVSQQAIKDAIKLQEEFQKKYDEYLQQTMWTLPSSMLYTPLPASDIEILSNSSFPNIRLDEELTDTVSPLIFPELDSVPDGTYNVEVIAVEYTRSRVDNPMVMVELEILNEGRYLGKNLRAYFVVREFGLVGWEGILKACGIEVEPTADFNIKSLISSRIVVGVRGGFVRDYLAA